MVIEGDLQPSAERWPLTAAMTGVAE